MVLRGILFLALFGFTHAQASEDPCRDYFLNSLTPQIVFTHSNGQSTILIQRLEAPTYKQMVKPKTPMLYNWGEVNNLRKTGLYGDLYTITLFVDVATGAYEYEFWFPQGLNIRPIFHHAYYIPYISPDLTKEEFKANERESEGLEKVYNSFHDSPYVSATAASEILNQIMMYNLDVHPKIQSWMEFESEQDSPRLHGQPAPPVSIKSF
jgi:hypothetical protein